MFGISSVSKKAWCYAGFKKFGCHCNIVKFPNLLVAVSVQRSLL